MRKLFSRKCRKQPSGGNSGSVKPSSASSSTARGLSANSMAATASSAAPPPPGQRAGGTSNVFAFGRPAPTTRRPPPINNEPPPAYSPSANPLSSGQATTAIPVSSTNDDRYAFLSHFDTLFLIDDSGSMAGRSWRETSAALRAITPICTAHDADGIDIVFLNHKPSNPTAYSNIRTPEAVEQIFNSVRPSGATPTGVRLNNILRPYLARCAVNHENVKPLNIIVITDGVPSDDVESVIISAAKKLDKADAPAWQIGIQFFQVGSEPGAAGALRDLDDGLGNSADEIRDMVDTVPWTGSTGSGLNAEGILKVVLGAVNRRLDRIRGSAELRGGR
ncbi:MAG: hypothetical protein M1840_000374 [Geoglossum simile]|nr:MAG: hypothetical protein M1840_000374 [Geoglossum simile]